MVRFPTCFHRLFKPSLRSGLGALALGVTLSATPAWSQSVGDTGSGLRAPAHAVNPADPWESFNRQVFQFNEGVDKAVLKPVAQAYQTVTPNVVRTGVSNVFGNLRDIWSTVNLFLQFKPKAGFQMGARVLLNSTLGLYGLLDLATPAGLERQSEDFGQTLGHWGMGSGPYLMLPLLGPSTLRDGTSFVLVDRQGDVLSELTPVTDRNVAVVVRVVDQRAKLLPVEKTMDAIALDRYSFIRDAYLQRRRFDIFDGNPPDEGQQD
jgi:phospholipid-binding lipoprotein MlaA